MGRGSQQWIQVFFIKKIHLLFNKYSKSFISETLPWLLPNFGIVFQGVLVIEIDSGWYFKLSILKRKAYFD